MNKIKTYIRRTLLLAVLLVSFAGITELLNFLLAVPDTTSRTILHNFYNTEEAIDTLYLGSSHVYCSINPEMTDPLSGRTSVNLATSGQSLEQSYLLLQEADHRHELKQVYLEMYYNIHLEGGGNYYTTLFFKVWDYMPWSALKLHSIIQHQPGELLPDVLLPFLRGRRDALLNSSYIQTRIVEKSTPQYQTYQTPRASAHNNGYIESFSVLSEDQLQFEYSCPSGNTVLSDKAETYLLKIIDYCRQNEIRLTLFSAPTTDLCVLASGNYDSYVSEVKKIAGANDIRYYDFNLCRETYFPFRNWNYFRDSDHLSSDGAEIFTPLLYDVTENNRTEYFYDSYKEKLQNTPPTVYGLINCYQGEDALWQIASNREEELEYRVEFIPNDRNSASVLIQDYDCSKIFRFESEEAGCFLISARQTGKQTPLLRLQIDK